MSLAALLLLTGVWAFAEAILWFVVADVPISWIAVRFGLKPAMLAAVVASLASTVGGLVAYGWADSDPAAATAAMALLPGITPATVGEAASAYAAQGWRAMLEASFTGVPYKLFAVTAARDGHELLPLLVATPFVRLPRFLLVALVGGTVSSLLEERMTSRRRLGLLAILWMGFYAIFWSVMPR